MSKRGTFTGVMPGFCPKGQFDAKYGQVPGLGLGANSFAPVLVALAGLSLHQATITSGNIGMKAENQEVAEAIQALTAQGTLLCQSATCKIAPTDAYNVLEPIALNLKGRVVPQIEKIDGFTLPKALAVAFVDIVLANEQVLKQTKEWQGFKPEAFRGKQTDLFNQYAQIVLVEAYWMQRHFNVYGQGIEATAGYMVAALANLFKMKANYPDLEIPGLEKAVAIIEQFKSQADKFEPSESQYVRQAVEFFDRLNPDDAASAMQIAGTVVKQFSANFGEYDLNGVQEQVYVDAIIGASQPPAIAVIFDLIANTVTMSDPLPVRPGAAGTQRQPSNKGREGQTAHREPALAGAGGTNGAHV